MGEQPAIVLFRGRMSDDGPFGRLSRPPAARARKRESPPKHLSISTRIQGIGVGSGVGEVGFVGEIVGKGKGGRGGNGFGVMGGGEVGRIGGAGFGMAGAL